MIHRHFDNQPITTLIRDGRWQAVARRMEIGDEVNLLTRRDAELLQRAFRMVGRRATYHLTTVRRIE